MTDTTRTTVTLSRSYMNLIEELVDVFGATKAQVISNIVEYFFNDNKNDPLVEKLRSRKRKEKPPDEVELFEKIDKYLEISDKIPFEVFVEHLQLDKEFVITRLELWGNKFNFQIIDNKITKMKKPSSK
ncbi:MAG: hypothetical protein ACW98D_18380 [Promethearchaeota archaeon]|jgi:hypothetical protein